jgi:TRAP-type C4-dicarboxylate transport system permease small subunit
MVTRIYERTIDIAAFLAGVLLIFLMLSVTLEVALRYFWGRPTSWVVEIAGYILLFIPFLVAAWVLKREGHVKMDLVLSRFSMKTQSLVNAITSIVSAIICLVLTWFGAKAALYFIGYQTPTVLMLPKSMIIAIIFIGSFLLSIQFLRRAYGYLGSWRTPEKEGDPIVKSEFGQQR